MTLKLVQIYNLKLKKNIQNRIFSAMLVDTKTGFKPNPPTPQKVQQIFCNGNDDIFSSLSKYYYKRP